MEKKILQKNIKDKWKFGKIRKIAQGEKVCILTYGPIVKLAFELKEICKENISIYSCHTLEPFDKNRLGLIMRRYKKNYMYRRSYRNWWFKNNYK